MKRRVFCRFTALALSVLLLLGTGCQRTVPQTADAVSVIQLKASSRGVRNFKKQMGDDFPTYPERSATVKDCYNIVPREISERYGFDMFNLPYDALSYLQYADKIYSIGEWGGSVISLAVADMNADGQWELFFTYVWGSGRTIFRAGYFDSATQEMKIFEDFQVFAEFEEVPYIVLNTDTDGALCVYRAEAADANQSVLDFNFRIGEKIATVTCDGGTITLLQENNAISNTNF